MRIAVDARPLASPLTGIGRYTEALLKRLIKSKHEWFLYSDRPLLTTFSEADNLTIRTGDAAGGTPGSLKWAQWAYVNWARRDNIEVFWSPRHHLPLLLPSSIRSVVTIHDLVWKRYPETMARKNYWLERILMGPSLNKATSIICVSNFTSTEVEKFFPDTHHKCHVIHEASELKSELDAPRSFISEPYYLFVGTLEPRKNLRRLLESYQLVKDELPKLVISGGRGWGNLNIDTITEEMGLTDRVIKTGYVTDSDLQSLYQYTHGLAMPSLYEGFGLPALEAMQHGKPVIGSIGSSIEEIVQQGGVMVDPYSTDEIARSLVKLFKEKDFYQRASKAAKSRAEDFSWDAAATATLEILAAR